MVPVSSATTWNVGLTCPKASCQGSCDPGHTSLVWSWVDRSVIGNSERVVWMKSRTSVEHQETQGDAWTLT